jgi:hypothetical protein
MMEPGGLRKINSLLYSYYTILNPVVADRCPEALWNIRREKMRDWMAMIIEIDVGETDHVFSK